MLVLMVMSEKLVLFVSNSQKLRDDGMSTLVESSAILKIILTIFEVLITRVLMFL